MQPRACCTSNLILNGTRVIAMPTPTPHAEPHSGEFQNAHDCCGCPEEAPGFAHGKMRNVVWRDQ